MKYNIIKSVLILTATLYAGFANASDSNTSTQDEDITVPTDIQSNEPIDRPGLQDKGHFEIGLALQTARSIDKEDIEASLGISLHGAFRYKNFFIDASQGSDDGLSMGFNLFKGKTWDVDLLASSASGRDSFGSYNGAGIRVTGYVGSAIVQYRLLTDVPDNNGVTGSARFGYNWQLRNWTFNSVIGAHYASKKTSNYWHGITAAEATEVYPEHRMGSTVNLTGKVGVSYPITEKFVFRSSVKYTLFDSAIVDAPLSRSNHEHSLSTSISYVF